MMVASPLRVRRRALWLLLVVVGACDGDLTGSGGPKGLSPMPDIPSIDGDPTDEKDPTGAGGSTTGTGGSSAASGGSGSDMGGMGGESPGTGGASASGGSVFGGMGGMGGEPLN